MNMTGNELSKVWEKRWLSVVILVGFVLALWETTTKDLNYAFDAKMYTKHIAYYSETIHFGAWQSNDIHYDQSPVLRYFLYSLIVGLLGIEPYVNVFRISLFLTSIIYYVVNPFLIYTLLKLDASDKIARAGILGWLLYQFVRWPAHSIAAGKWQYSYTSALLFGALIVSYRGLSAQGIRDKYVYGLATGCLLGFAGLTQYTYTLFGVITVSIAAVWRKELKFLMAAYTSGIGFTGYALLASSPEHFTTTLQKTSGSSLGLKPFEDIVKLILGPNLFTGILLSVLVVTIARIHLRGLRLPSVQFELLGVVVFGFWLFSALTGASPGGLGYVNQFIGGILLFVTGGYLTYGLVTERELVYKNLPPLWPTTQLLISGITSISAGVAAISLPTATALLGAIALITALYTDLVLVSQFDIVCSSLLADLLGISRLRMHEIFRWTLGTLLALALLTYLLFSYDPRVLLVRGTPDQQFKILLYLFMPVILYLTASVSIFSK